MDLGLPDINGIEVTKELRQLEREGSSVPIVALTAHHTEEDKKLGLGECSLNCVRLNLS
jgi:DNA-binding response OmpR family regulator